MILLNKLRLINWYGFGSTTIPIGKFSLIAGKNGNGKSVLLDAIKYALYGDTVFNKSTENKGSRTLSSYTRGLLDATAKTYMRPSEKFPTICTHIVLEMFDDELKKSFILGTVIETDPSDGIRTNRYVLENRKLDDICHSFEQDNKVIPYNTVELMKTLNVKLLDANEGVLKFMQITGLRLNDQQIISFRRKLRSIMSYDPNAKIDQFIRESVLEDKKVDFTKLVEAKKNIERLNGTFDKIDGEIKELDQIIKLYDDLKNAENVILADDIKITYKKMLRLMGDIEETMKNIDMGERQLQIDNETLILLEENEKELNQRIPQAKANLDQLDCSKAINMAQERLHKLKEDKFKLEQEVQELADFQTRINRLLVWFKKLNKMVKEEQVIMALETTSYKAAEKESGIYCLLEQVKEYRDEILKQIVNKEVEQNQNLNEQSKQQSIIRDCIAKKVTFSDIPDYLKLRDDINKEFKKNNIHSEAKFACEYVLDIKEEKWRDSIETFLGKKRYTILVDPDYYEQADEVLNKTKNKGAHLFNTKLLRKKKLILEEDSVVHFIDIKNEIAKQYFTYQLGRIHASEINQIKNYENAISVEGRVSVAMDSYFLDFSKLKFYCLGQKTLELNRMRAEKELKRLKTEAENRNHELCTLKEQKSYLEQIQQFFKKYNYDAKQQYEKLLKEYCKQENELKQLEEAQKENVEYMELRQLYDRYVSERRALQKEKENVYQSKIKMQTQIDVNTTHKREKEDEKRVVDSQLKQFKEHNFDIFMKAKHDYDNHCKNGSNSPGGTLKDRGRSERAHREVQNNLTGAQSSYNACRSPENHLPINEISRSEYEARRTKIWMDDLQEIKEQLNEQTRRYENIFKKEFVLTVFKSCKTAKDDIRRINLKLSRLSFKSKYEFSVNYIKDGSDYELILKYASYLNEREELGTSDGQITFDTMTSYSNSEGEEIEKEIKKIINRVIENNDRDMIEKYADYRNYMTYEILLTNEILNKAKLSKQSGYNSGAEVQIPYMLILLSALLMIYDEKLNSTRLVFIDEPFAKMDPTNVKVMLQFMKDQRLQMIFCAPDKTELIGNVCNVILPVLRIQADLMEIGIIEIHEGV